MYLLKSNAIEINKNSISKDEILAIVRQKPNQKTFGIPIKLFIFNAIDSTKIVNKRLRKKKSFDLKIEQKKEKVKRINEKRLQKAIIRGDIEYDQKVLSDTIFSQTLLLEKLKYKFGQKPIVFDSILFNKSIEQIAILLKKKGYYYGEVKASLDYDNKKRNAAVTYKINTGPQFKIDSVNVVGSQVIRVIYSKFEKKQMISERIFPNLLAMNLFTNFIHQTFIS
jgi:outer membrane protein assembly factor BamA